MSYSREIFSLELDKFLSEKGKIDYAKIAHWAYETRLNNLAAIDPDVSKWLLQLGAMDMGSEYEFSEEELHNLVRTARSHSQR